MYIDNQFWNIYKFEFRAVITHNNSYRFCIAEDTCYNSGSIGNSPVSVMQKLPAYWTASKIKMETNQINTTKLGI